RADLNSFQYNSDLNFTYKTDITSSISSTSTLGGSWQYEERESIGINATGLPPVVETAAGGSILEQGESRSQISYWGAFFQHTFGDAFNLFKLRASWGQAGNLTALSAYARFSNYNPSALTGTVSLIPSTQLGNETLKPERQDETELGFDAGLLNNRIGIEFSYYKQKVTDLLLQRVLAPSSGFSSRFENVGNLENTGVEVLLRGAPIKTKDFGWDLTATFSKNKNEVTNVAGGGRIALPGSFSTNYVIEGQPLGVFYHGFYARNEDGSIALDDAGYPFRGETEEGERSKVIGDPNPDWFGSLINEFT